MREPRIWWAGTEKGWIMDVEQPISARAVQICVDFTLKIQSQRLLGLKPGARRDECLETIKALKIGKVSQNIIGIGDKVLYDAYKSEKKIFELGGI